MKGHPAVRRKKSARTFKVRSHPIRLLTAVPICDGHDSAIVTINFELVRHGCEVIYLGYHRSVDAIARAAVQEDVRAVGLSSYNGGHVEFFTELRAALRKLGGGHIGLFGGGGGTITPDDAKLLKRRGVDEVFFAGTPLSRIVEFVNTQYGSKPPVHTRPGGGFDREVALALSTNETRPSSRGAPGATTIVGITGPGGAGKTTLIDELALRFLQARPRERLAILCHDPSLPGKGALLADRAAMIYAQHERIFIRSLATRGAGQGLAASTRSCVAALAGAGFGLVLTESAGVGQEDMPFARSLVNKQVLVMSPDYGSRSQLQKIAMLESADLVVLNKSDLPGARTALAELDQRLKLNRREQKLIATMATRHRDQGVDQLFSEIAS